MRKNGLLIGLLIVVLTCSCHKDNNTYVFSGHVYHQNISTPVAGATVIIHEHFDHGHLDGVKLGTVVTDQNGFYSLSSSDLQDGFVEIYIEASGGTPSGTGSSSSHTLAAENTIDVTCQ